MRCCIDLWSSRLALLCCRCSSSTYPGCFRVAAMAVKLWMVVAAVSGVELSEFLDVVFLYSCDLHWISLNSIKVCTCKNCVPPATGLFGRIICLFVFFLGGFFRFSTLVFVVLGFLAFVSCVFSLAFVAFGFLAFCLFGLYRNHCADINYIEKD